MVTRVVTFRILQQFYECIASSFNFRFQLSVRTCYHLLINHSRLLGINKQEKITCCVIITGTETPTGTAHLEFWIRLCTLAVIKTLTLFGPNTDPDPFSDHRSVYQKSWQLTRFTNYFILHTVFFNRGSMFHDFEGSISKILLIYVGNVAQVIFFSVISTQ